MLGGMCVVLRIRVGVVGGRELMGSLVNDERVEMKMLRMFVMNGDGNLVRIFFAFYNLHPFLALSFDEFTSAVITGSFLSFFLPTPILISKQNKFTFKSQTPNFLLQTSLFPPPIPGNPQIYHQ